MQYISTRNIQNRISSMEAIKQGISPEGGLFVPEGLPSVSLEAMKDLMNSTYQERAVHILSLFLTDYMQEDIQRCVYSAYRSDNFASEEIAPVVSIGENLHIQELWHGPTAAFKDIALQILPHLMTTALQKTGENKEVIILAATSGDTGKAALEGFKDVPGTHILVFYPQEGVSTMQRLQMVTQEGENVRVTAVDGNFDDAQSGVKEIFADPILKKDLAAEGYQFSSANSINWGRLVPQIVYYFSGYLDLVKDGVLELGETMNVVVPTGNFGNILAAWYARHMGLPIHKLICASNDNNVLTDFINTGIYDRKRPFLATISPSMDILISSNLERLLFELADRDDAKVRGWMQALSSAGSYRVDDAAHAQLAERFWGGFATEQQTQSVIRDTYERYGYTLDPHTAVGKKVYDDYTAQTGDARPTLLVSTASPFKFPKEVLTAILDAKAANWQEETELSGDLAQITGMDIPEPLQGLEEKTIRHRQACGREDMKSEIYKLIKE